MSKELENTYQSKVINSTTACVKSLEKLEKIRTKISDEKLKRSANQIRKIIISSLRTINSSLKKMSHVENWTTLQVAFFGETNAGKSTLIEALINGDGIDIGDGRKDHTQQMKEYSYENFQLIDMPGIEGREEKVIKQIKEAISKSHVIFYVVGTGKSPERKTIKKMQQLLSKRDIPVYCIINEKGRSSKYRKNKRLKKDKGLIDDMEKNFKSVLQKNYSGHIFTNAHIALLASPNLDQGRFGKDLDKAIQIFGNSEEIIKLSEINEIIKTLEAIYENHQDQIKISNTYSFLKALEHLSEEIQNKNELKKWTTKAKKLHIENVDNIERIINKYHKYIEIAVDKKMKTLKAELKRNISDAIDQGSESHLISSRLRRTQQQVTQALQEEIKKYLEQMRQELESRIKKFENRISFLNFDMDINIDELLEELKVTFTYIFSQIFDSIFSLFGTLTAFLLNPILGVVAAILSVARKIWEWFFGDPHQRKLQAKKKANKEIDDKIFDITQKITSDLSKKLIMIKQKTNLSLNKVNRSIQKLEKITSAVNDNIFQVTKTRQYLSTILAREIMGNEVEFSCIDRSNSSAIVVGLNVNDQAKKFIAEKLRVDSVKMYFSYEEWLESRGISQKNLQKSNDDFDFYLADLFYSDVNGEANES